MSTGECLGYSDLHNADFHATTELDVKETNPLRPPPPPPKPKSYARIMDNP